MVCGDDFQALVGFSSYSIADLSLFLYSWGCAFSINQAAQTSYCDFQNRIDNAIDSVQLTPVLLIIPPCSSSQLINLLISLRINRVREGLPCFPSTETTSLHLCMGPLASSVTISFRHSCLQTTSPLVPGIPASPTYLRTLILQSLLPPYHHFFPVYWITVIKKQNKIKNPSFAPSQCPVTALFPSFPLRPNSSKDLSIINVSTFHLPFSLESILSRIQPQQNSETAFLKASSDLVISKGQFSVFLLDLSAALNMVDHCLLLELSLRGLCSMNILKIPQASKSGRYKHKFCIFYTVVVCLQPNY